MSAQAEPVGAFCVQFKYMSEKLSVSIKPNKPSVEEVEKYIKRWEETEEYSVPAKSLSELFKNFPLNNNLDEIIVKVCTLDVIFSANANRWFFQISKHILKYDFDVKFKSSEFDVNDFSSVDVLDKKTNKTKKRKFYSFATKYCNHHKPLDYPIYDSYVDQALWYFQTEYHFRDFDREELKEYKKFKETLKDFRKFFGLDRFDLREIDKYLWLLGKGLLRSETTT